MSFDLVDATMSIQLVSILLPVPVSRKIKKPPRKIGKTQKTKIEPLAVGENFREISLDFLSKKRRKKEISFLIGLLLTCPQACGARNLS
jgi:hypothetical protein